MSGIWDFTTDINTKIFTHCFMKKYDMREIEHIVDGKDCLTFYGAWNMETILDKRQGLNSYVHLRPWGKN